MGYRYKKNAFKRFMNVSLVMMKKLNRKTCAVIIIRDFPQTVQQILIKSNQSVQQLYYANEQWI